MEGCHLPRKDRQERRGGVVTFCVSERCEHMELHLGVDEEVIKNLRVRIKGKAWTGDIVVGVC